MPRSPIIPRGAGGNRRSLEGFIQSFADHYEKQFEEVYVREMEILLNDIIQHTPIATGAAAGVEYNLVGNAHVTMTSSHPAYGLAIGNLEGESGWQLSVEQTSNSLTLSIINPMWEPYLKFLEFGVVTPADPRAKPHFVNDAWRRMQTRRNEIREEIRNG